MSPTALVTGISGQDGAYLARLLLAKGYRVVGAARRVTPASTARLAELKIDGEVDLMEFDLTDVDGMQRDLELIKPDEIYNLAAQSFVGLSFTQPLQTVEIDAVGPAKLLHAIHTAVPTARFYQASSSEMFGKVADNAVAQSERDAFHPRSPYAVSKLFAHWLTVNYRESFGMFAVSGILFNHESPLRGRDFVTRKITVGLAEIKQGRRDGLVLGNIDARRDWGFAADYVDGMWRMLQQPTPSDFVLATGRSESVATFVEIAATTVGIPFAWEGSGTSRKGIDRKTGRTIVNLDPVWLRPADVDALSGDAGRARQLLGWTAQGALEDTIAAMTEADMRRVRDGTLWF